MQFVHAALVFGKMRLVEEVETIQLLLNAWENVLALIESLQPKILIPSHLEEGLELDTQADLNHNCKRLELYHTKVKEAKTKPKVEEMYETFKNAFPKATNNLDFFLGHLSNHHGEGGQVWEENCHHNVSAPTADSLHGYILNRK